VALWKNQPLGNEAKYKKEKRSSRTRIGSGKEVQGGDPKKIVGCRTKIAKGNKAPDSSNADPDRQPGSLKKGGHTQSQRRRP